MDGKLLILAGGMSSRMKKALDGEVSLDQKLVEQANNLPKGMIGVGLAGRPFLDYLLYNAHRAGYNEVVLLLNPKDTVTQPHFDQLVAEGKAWGLTIKYAIQHIPANREKPLGTADAVYQGVVQTPEWAGHRFTVCNSDNLYSVNALRTLRETTHDNALISYDPVALGVEPERVKAFAILKTDADGHLKDIIEKPSDEQMAEVLKESGRIGVSMNIFAFSTDQILPVLERVPLNPIRNEKELPTAVNMLIEAIPNSVLVIPLAESVPDLTSKTDISVVQTYLEQEFGVF
ncbi:MAG: sugar phosphate nucleotidyltransferase [Spirosomataceae bacterium]